MQVGRQPGPIPAAVSNDHCAIPQQETIISTRRRRSGEGSPSPASVRPPGNQQSPYYQQEKHPAGDFRAAMTGRNDPGEEELFSIAQSTRRPLPSSWFWAPAGAWQKIAGIATT